MKHKTVNQHPMEQQVVPAEQNVFVPLQTLFQEYVVKSQQHPHSFTSMLPHSYSPYFYNNPQQFSISQPQSQVEPLRPMRAVESTGLQRFSYYSAPESTSQPQHVNPSNITNSVRARKIIQRPPSPTIENKSNSNVTEQTRVRKIPQPPPIIKNNPDNDMTATDDTAPEASPRPQKKPRVAQKPSTAHIKYKKFLAKKDTLIKKALELYASAGADVFIAVVNKEDRLIEGVSSACFLPMIVQRDPQSPSIAQSVYAEGQARVNFTAAIPYSLIDSSRVSEQQQGDTDSVQKIGDGAQQQPIIKREITAQPQSLAGSRQPSLSSENDELSYSSDNDNITSSSSTVQITETQEVPNEDTPTSPQWTSGFVSVLKRANTSFS